MIRSKTRLFEDNMVFIGLDPSFHTYLCNKLARLLVLGKKNSFSIMDIDKILDYEYDVELINKTTYKFTKRESNGE